MSQETIYSIVIGLIGGGVALIWPRAASGYVIIFGFAVPIFVYGKCFAASTKIDTFRRIIQTQIRNAKIIKLRCQVVAFWHSIRIRISASFDPVLCNHGAVNDFRNWRTNTAKLISDWTKPGLEWRKSFEEGRYTVFERFHFVPELSDDTEAHTIEAIKVHTGMLESILKKVVPSDLIIDPENPRTDLQKFQAWLDCEIIYGNNLKKNPNVADLTNWYEEKISKGVLYALGKKGLIEFSKWGVADGIAGHVHWPKRSTGQGINKIIDDILYCLKMLRDTTAPDQFLNTFRPADLPPSGLLGSTIL